MQRKYLLLVLFISVVSFSIAARRPVCTFDPFCFYYTSGCTLAGCAPFYSEVNITCDECVQTCEQNQTTGVENEDELTCKSIVYDCETQTCNVYCDDDTLNGKLVSHSSSIYLRYSIENCPYMPAQTVPVSTGICPAGQSARIVMVDGYVYPELHIDKEVHVQDKKECALICLINELPDGTPVDCHSAQYHAGQCIISASAALAQDKPLTKDQDAAFYQKFCFDSNLVANCDTIMEEVPQKALIGQNKQTIDATSVQDCFMHCLTAQRDLGFACKSGIYFYEGTQNCILNVETRETKPDLFTDLPADEKGTYFSPKCGNGEGAAGGGTPTEGATTQGVTTTTVAATTEATAPVTTTAIAEVTTTPATEAVTTTASA